MRASVILLALVLAGCQTTIRPQQVHQRQASHSATGQDSGLVSTASEGFIVNSDWIAGYDALLAKYGQSLTPPRKTGDRDGITLDGKYYRISDAALERQLYMNSRRVNDGP